MADQLRVGQIGLGEFGARVALRLLWNGYPTLQVWDVQHQVIRIFTGDYGGQISGSPSMMAQQCDVVVTALPSARELREVCFGWEGLANGLEPGGIVLNLGNGDPFEIVALAKELGEKNLFLVDAPAIGTPQLAKEGKLTLIVGGDDAAIETCRPILETLSNKVLRTGAAGSAQAASAIADYRRAAELLVACEAIRLGDKFGFAPGAVLDVSDAIAGEELRRTIAAEVTTRRFRSGLQLGVVRRSVAGAQDFAERLRVEAPLLTATLAAFTAAEGDIGYGADYSSILEWLDRLVPSTGVAPPKAEAESDSAVPTA